MLLANYLVAERLCEVRCIIPLSLHPPKSHPTQLTTHTQ
jgi:hypothetical protein